MISVADKNGWHTMYARDFVRKIIDGDIAVSDIDDVILTKRASDILSVISEARAYKGCRPILYEVTTKEHPGTTIYLKPSELTNWIESTVRPGYEFTVNTVAYAGERMPGND